MFALFKWGKMLYDTFYANAEDACVASKTGHLKRGLTPMADIWQEISKGEGARAAPIPRIVSNVI